MCLGFRVQGLGRKEFVSLQTLNPTLVVSCSDFVACAFVCC